MSVHEPPGDQEAWTVPPHLRLELLAALAQAPKPRATMTYEEFLAWADEDTVAEWVEGRIIVPSPASARHQFVAQFLASVLTSYAALRELGTVIAAPFQMKLASSGREPDVLFVAKAHRARLQPTFLDGPADLVVEVVSPESVGRDRGDKFYEYERAGIPEYWLIDPDTRRAEFYRLDEHGAYQLIQPDGQGNYHSAVLPGFWLHVVWLWQDELPAIEPTLLAIAGDDYARYLIERLRGGGFLGGE